MATGIVDQPNRTIDPERIELAFKALSQIDALLPHAQRMADEGGNEPDALLGLLGRIRQMNDAASRLLDYAESDDEVIEHTRVEILGRREAHHD